jgi:hypothetical protein
MTFSWDAAPTATAGTDIGQCGTANVYFTGSSATAGSTVGWGLLSGIPGESGTGNVINPGTNNDPTTWGFTPTSPTGVRHVRLTSVPPLACSAPTITDDLIITWGQAPSVTVVTTPLNSCTGLAPFSISGVNAAGTGNLSWALSSVSGTAAITGGGTTTTPTFDPSTPSGTYSLTLTNTGTGECNSVNDFGILTVNWDLPPVIEAGTSFSACEATPVSVTTSSISSPFTSMTWVDLGTGTGTGSFITTHPTNPAAWVYQATSPGTINLQLQVTGAGAVCSVTPATDQVTITFAPEPTVDAGGPSDECITLAYVEMTGATSSNGSSYLWTEAAPTTGSLNQGTLIGNARFTPTATSGTTVLTATVNGSGACSSITASDTRTVAWDVSPSGVAGAPATTCGTDPHPMTGSSASGTFSSVSWSNPANPAWGSWTTTHPTVPSNWVFTPLTPSGAFTSTLTIAGSGACLGTDIVLTRLITWQAPPTVDAGTYLNFCTGAAAITLSNAVVTGAISSYNWTGPIIDGVWSNSGTYNTATFDPTVPFGTVTGTLTINGSGNCSAYTTSDNASLVWNAPPQILEVQSIDVTSCATDNGLIFITAIGSPTVEYSIDNGSNYDPSNTYQDLAAGTYNIIITDATNCLTSYGTPIVIDPATTPVFTASTSDALCNGAEDGVVAVTVTSGGTGPYTIDVVSAIKTYTEEVVNISTLTNVSVVAGTYNVTVTDRFGCDATMGPYVINQPAALQVSTMVLNNTNCTGTDGQITVTASQGTAPYSFSFNGGSFSGANVFSSLGTGNYPIIVRDANGCDISFEETIGGPFDADAGLDGYICAGTSFPMNAQVNVNAVTVAGGGSSNYALSSIAHNPRTPSTWTNVVLLDDQVSGAVPISFPFTFYGNNYTNLYISSNGFITFNNDANSGCCTGQFLPNGGSPNNLVALCWEDLNPNSGGTIRYGVFGTSPNRAFVIEYNAIQHFGGGYPVTGQILLFESTNNVEVHNTSVPTDGASGHTQGIENAIGNLATTSRNSQGSWTETNSAYLFQPPYDLTTINYSWLPSTGLSNANILNPTVSGLTADQTYTLTVEIVGICSVTDQMTVHVSTLATQSSGTYGTAPNVSVVTNVVCNGNNNGCITVNPTSGQAPYLIQGPLGGIQVYGGKMKTLTVSNTSGTALTNYQVRMTVPYVGGMRADFGDIRFYDGTTGNVGDVLSYWVESFTLGGTATCYVKVPNVPNGGTTLYMTYGNASLTSQSDPDNTLLLYEDMMSTPSGNFFGNASYINHQYTRLTQAINSTNGQLDYNLNPSTGGNGYVAEFDFWIGGGNGADALYQYSDCNPRPQTEDDVTGGYTFAYDTYQDQHQIKWNGGTTATNAESNFDNAIWRAAKVEQFNTTGRMYLDGTLRLTGTVTADNIGNSFGFGARTGGLNNEHRVKNIRVRKLVSPEPTVTFGAEQLPNNQFCGLAPGSYSISVWDVAECAIVEVNIPITQPTPLAISPIVVTNTWCYLTTNGQLDITVSGGTQITPPPPYLFNWSGPSGFTSTSGDLTGLSNGIYSVIVADDNACTATANATVLVSIPINPGNFTWKGTVSQDWFTIGNWDCGVPDATSDVIIPAAPIGGNTPLITGGTIGEVFRIRVMGNLANLLTIDPGSKLKVYRP